MWSQSTIRISCLGDPCQHVPLPDWSFGLADGANLRAMPLIKLLQWANGDIHMVTPTMSC